MSINHTQDKLNQLELNIGVIPQSRKVVNHCKMKNKDIKTYIEEINSMEKN